MQYSTGVDIPCWTGVSERCASRSGALLAAVRSVTAGGPPARVVSRAGAVSRGRARCATASAVGGKHLIDRAVTDQEDRLLVGDDRCERAVVEREHAGAGRRV